ncbi:hypothetical protein BDZ88DRAFT_162040 [Geranomyces variabilis]|nr:hypothetical protein BDZ88DRAFT_162040 [Geranomyces variabilis]
MCIVGVLRACLVLQLSVGVPYAVRTGLRRGEFLGELLIRCHSHYRPQVAWALCLSVSMGCLDPTYTATILRYLSLFLFADRWGQGAEGCRKTGGSVPSESPLALSGQSQSRFFGFILRNYFLACTVPSRSETLRGRRGWKFCEDWNRHR